MEAQQLNFTTPEEYFKQEALSETKHEYYNGEIFAMAGASPTHNQITINLYFILMSQLKNKPCRPYPSDQRIKVSKDKLYTYPDVSVVCGKEIYDTQDKNTITNPVLIIEVLSDSTERYDRGDKFGFYRKIESLQNYILVNHKTPKIEVFTKQGIGWFFTETIENVKSVHLDSIECTLNLEEVYNNVSLEEEKQTL